MTMGLLVLIAGLLGQAAPAATPAPPFKVGARVKEPRKIKNVAPEYPKDAKRAGIAGVVIIEATISPEGEVAHTTVLRDLPLLGAAAVEAVKQWRYEPTLLDGVAVPVIMTVTVNFKLPAVDSHDLLASLRHADAGVREAAADNLGALPVPNPAGAGHVKNVITALERLAQSDESPAVRAAAARSLSRLSGRPLPASPKPAASPTPSPTDIARPSSRPLAWGVFVDPLGRCEATAVEDRVEIELPPAEVALSTELGQERAPRLMKAVDGDFAAEVRVGSLPDPAGRQRAFRGAGLLVRKDEDTVARLESAVVLDGGPAPDARSLRYVLFEVRAGGQLLDVPPAPVALADAPTDLRLEQRGDQLLALVSQGGAPWRQVGRAWVGLPRGMEVGVTAVNTASSAFTATLHGFTVVPADAEPAERPRLPPEPLPLSMPTPAAGQPGSAPGLPASDALPTLEVDAPPKVLHTVRPQYPQDAFVRRIEGTVLIEAVVDTEGTIVRARVIQSVPGLDEAALAAVRQWRFQPAVKHGKPVATLIHMPVAFRIYDKKK